MNKEPLINVYDFVCLMREQRTNMIQTQVNCMNSMISLSGCVVTPLGDGVAMSDLLLWNNNNLIKSYCIPSSTLLFYTVLYGMWMKHLHLLLDFDA